MFLLDTAAQMVNSALDRRNAMRMADKTFGQNMKMAEYQYSKDLEMWNKGNLYNSPQAQMERLKSAGLNPNLVYGTGAVGNTTAQLPKFNAPSADYTHVPPIQLPNIISAYQDFTVKNAQIDNLREQNKVIHETGRVKGFEANLFGDTYNERADKYFEDLHVQRNKRVISQLQSQMIQKLWPYQLEGAKVSLNQKKRQLELMDTQQSKMQSEIEFLNKKNEWYLTQLFGNLFNQSARTLTSSFGLGKFNRSIKPKTR